MAVLSRLAGLAPDHPFRAFIPIDVSLAGRVAAAVEIAPVKGVVPPALIVGLVLKGTMDLLAAFAAVRAGIPVFPGRVNLDQRRIGLGHGGSGESNGGSELSLQIAEGHRIGVDDQTRAHIGVFPEPQGSEKVIAEKRGQEVKPDPGYDSNGKEAHEAEARHGPSHFLDLTQKSSGKRTFEFYSFPCGILDSFHLSSDPNFFETTFSEKILWRQVNSFPCRQGP
jgi:hypothetical protein